MLSATLMPPTQAFFSGSSGNSDIRCRRISSRRRDRIACDQHFAALGFALPGQHLDKLAVESSTVSLVATGTRPAVGAMPRIIRRGSVPKVQH